MSVSSRPAATKAKYSIESIEYFASVPAGRLYRERRDDFAG